ncbi:hypothetical protein [Spirillospora sp. CA-128828]|uniref:hypothetical protein n=1 Tax=Spirillospora sp. CA-128828 TaxID=3240033 RepID=UPI003D89EDB4
MQLVNGALAPKPYEATPAEKVEAAELGISSADYHRTRGGGASHSEEITFVKSTPTPRTSATPSEAWPSPELAQVTACRSTR